MGMDTETIQLDELDEYTAPTGSIDHEEIPGCCGVGVLHSIDDVKNADDAEKLINAALDSYKGKAMALYTTNHTQKTVAEALQSAGFSVLLKGKNGTGRSTITLWGKVITPVPATRTRGGRRQATRQGRR